MAKHLEVVGQLTVPEGVMRHRFAREAMAGVRIMAGNYEAGESLEQVLGTKNTAAVELYGWTPNVAEHNDCTGFVYLATINKGQSTLMAIDSPFPDPSGPVTSIDLAKGVVVRLNDIARHWTKDDRPRLCVFLGSFDEPCDAAAVALLQAAVNALASGVYYGAPRASKGFRAIMDDECLVANEDSTDCDTMLLVDAKAKGLHYETCAYCDKPASLLDHQWPYGLLHRCVQHVSGGIELTQMEGFAVESPPSIT
jgi:hypothetical protein